MEHEDKTRMYGLVPYQLTGIQKGIQYGHALQEYNNLMINRMNLSMEEMAEDSHKMILEINLFDQWRDKDKTFIILNGGTSNDGKNYSIGSMESHLKVLEENNITCGIFREPDLNFMLSGIVFLVPEQVYKKYDKGDDKKYWLDFDNYLLDICKLETTEYLKNSKNLEEVYYEKHKEWIDYIGGEENVFLREFLKNFKLA